MRSWVLLVGLVTGPVLLNTGRSPAQNGTVFAPKNGMYTATLPDGEESGDRIRVLSIGRHKVPVESSRAVADGVAFTAASMGFPAVVMRDVPADKRFDILGGALAKGLKGKVTSADDIVQDGVPGKEFRIELSGRAARLQVYTVSGWVVFGVVEGSQEQVGSAKADAFFGSLELTAKAKEVFGRVKR